MVSTSDKQFLDILKREKNVTCFLDAFFGFLYRCTDFYIESEAGQKLGFPPGVAENLVRTTFMKWKNQSPSNAIANSSSTSVANESQIPAVVHEVEIATESCVTKNSRVKLSQLPESYNGANRKNYSWSQTISDLDVSINIPSCVRSTKDLQVNILAEEINISVNTECLVNSNAEDVEQFVKKDTIDLSSKWTNIFRGKLSFKIQRKESLWSLMCGQYVSIHLEKCVENWWESLLVDEPKIKLNEIDCSRDISELDDFEQMKVQELMWNQQQKMLGKPTSDQIKMEQILKQAWDAEGSPFKGQPYDPSVVKFD